MKMETRWYEVSNIGDFDTPALLFYPDRIKKNISKLVEQIDPNTLRPHVKTNKTAEVSQLMIDAGITRFKAATIAEAEMLGMIQAPDVLLAYPPTIPKIERLIALIQKYPDTSFSCLVDHPSTVEALFHLFSAADLTASVYIDLNCGMGRTGILPSRAMPLYKQIISLPALKMLGIHAYDGHIKEKDPMKRAVICHQAFEPVLVFRAEIEKISRVPVTLIAGGSPTCFIHAEAGNRECSPGTFVFWDKGYTEQLPEQPFEWAALLACRVISIPDSESITVDLGYKSVSAENPPPRVFFLNAPDAMAVAHSEEHLVLKVSDSNHYHPGDVLYGIPWHICPSVALYEKAYVTEQHKITASWKVIARDRIISV